MSSGFAMVNQSVLSRQVQLTRRPVNVISPQDFRIVEVPISEPPPGHVVVRNSHMSVDPYMRRRMDDVPSYIPPFGLHEALPGPAVGQIVMSADDTRPVGQWVRHDAGWRDVALLPARHTAAIDATADSASTYLGLLGIPGMTAYVGLLQIAGISEGETLFVSGAAGAVGSIVGQIGKIKGARVIGSAGTDAKTSWLTNELGFDAAINYRTTPIAEGLAHAAPDGVDVYFDNVGYDHLDAALQCANKNARIAVCGTIADYDTTSAPDGPRNLFKIVAQRIRIQGFIVSDHWKQLDAFAADMNTWLQNGELRYHETVLDGLDNAVSAMSDMLHGANVGKMIVKL